jgi:hypothetical protein
MTPSRQLHEEGHLARDAVEAAELLEQLEQPAGEKAKEAKEAEVFTCRGCNVPYTDATSSGAKTKKNCWYCSKTCMEDSKKAPRAPPKQCEHLRRKDTCRDCGTGYCDHGRQKSRCKDCGTGYCQHGRQKSQCKDCGTGRCLHGRRKDRCKDCRSKAIDNIQQAIGNRQ